MGVRCVITDIAPMAHEETMMKGARVPLPAWFRDRRVRHAGRRWNVAGNTRSARWVQLFFQEAARTYGLTDHRIVANHRAPLPAKPLRQDTAHGVKNIWRTTHREIARSQSRRID